MELDLPIEGKAAPPRQNGELVFDAPWQGRIFGLAVSLAEQGLFSWSDFQTGLIAAITRWENRPAAQRGDWCYYGCWLEALEQLTRQKGLVPSRDLEQRSRDLADRPAGHDH